jgi:peptidoglycan endopeptidase LytF
MYSPLTQIKLWSILAIVMIMLLHGCATKKKPKAPEPIDYSVEDSETYHTVQRGETLHEIAKLYDLDFKEIAALNDIPSPYTIHPGQSLQISGASVTAEEDSGEAIPINLPPPSKSQALKKFNKTKNRRKSGERRGEGNYHTVQPGETLYSIAKNYGQNYQKVASWNKISSPYLLEVGQRLRITKPKMTGRSHKTRSKHQSPVKKGTVSHVVQRGETLSRIARRYGYSLDQVAKWNGLEPPYHLSSGRRLRVAPPPTSKRSTQSRQKKLSTKSSSGNKIIYHTVVQGDTLYNIGRRYGSDVADIAKRNNLKQPYTLSLGQRLQVAQNKKGSKTPSSQKPNSTGKLNSVRHNAGYHIVVRGETLFSISKSYGHTPSEIAAWNNLRHPYNLSVGKKLRVYPPSGILKTVARRKKTSPPSSSSTGYHQVVQGDTLYSIARRYGVRANDLERWNDLLEPHNLSVGQHLRVSPQGTRRTGHQASYRGRASGRTHKVKPGETLKGIAAKYKVSAHDLSQWNGIGSPYTIFPGQILRLVPP